MSQQQAGDPPSPPFVLYEGIPTLGDAPNKLALVRRRLEWLLQLTIDAREMAAASDEDPEEEAVSARFLGDWVQERLDEIA